MTELDHITAGRTAIRTLIVAVVLTAAIVGTGGTAAADVIDGKGNDVLTGRTSDDIDEMTYEVIDGKGNDPIIYAFPIDNVTVFGYQAVSIDQQSAASFALPGVLSVLDDAIVATILPQDMDPY